MKGVVKIIKDRIKYAKESQINAYSQEDVDHYAGVVIELESLLEEVQTHIKTLPKEPRKPREVKVPEIGTWGFITGSHSITNEKWKESFPNDWFGKVIGYKKVLNSKQLIVRTYRQKRKGYEKHTHLNVDVKYFKEVI